MTGTTNQVTQLLLEAQQGKQEAVDQLLPLVYGELRRIAAAHLRRERDGHTLQPTALVHEAYLQLVGQRGLQWQSRAHFMGIAAYLMRQVLVAHARRRSAAKRAGVLVTLDESLAVGGDADVNILALNEALDALAQADPQRARIVELRYFGGLSIDEAAEVLGVSEATVERGWRTARAWLHRELTAGGRKA
jgi:RNA polymerase sigma factor (TIGR02999 family)